MAPLPSSCVGSRGRHVWGWGRLGPRGRAPMHVGGEGLSRPDAGPETAEPCAKEPPLLRVSLRTEIESARVHTGAAARAGTTPQPQQAR